MPIHSRTEPSVVISARSGKSTNGPWGSITLRPVSDKDSLSQPIDYRCDPPSLADAVAAGQTGEFVLRTQVEIFGRTAETRTLIVEAKAA